jgi:hypothetical protein
MTPADVATLVEAGDLLAECLGLTTAKLDAGECATAAELQKVRRGIVAWHRLKTLVSA